MGCGSSKDTASTQNNDKTPVVQSTDARNTNDAEKESDTGREKKSALDVFREESLVAHNAKRALHGAPPIKLSAELNAIAQSYAETLAKTGKFEHSDKETRKGAGENLAGHSNAISGAAVVDMWYNEINDYDWSNPRFVPGTGHFTQVVWKDCTHLGMGMSPKGASGMHIFVANYTPHGNVLGQFQDNVLPLQS